MPPKIILPRRALPKLPPPYRQNPVYQQQPPSAPVHLSASLVVPSGGNGSVQQLSLKNPMGQDMEILEIKFEVSCLLSSGGGTGGLAGSVACEMYLGTEKITNGSVPLWNFCRAENLGDELMIDTNGSALVPGVFQALSWRLPRPLFIPAGASISANFTNLGIVAGSVNVRIGVSARSTFVQPKRVYIPWIAGYTTRAFNPISAAGSDVTPTTALVNPHSETVYLQRFTGRVISIDASKNVFASFPYSIGGQSLTLKIIDSYGRPIVRNFTPFDSVFSPLTASWDMDNGAALDPQSYYTATFKKSATSYSGANANIAAQGQISLVGWREKTYE